jgi:nucleosome assembly protein 1-like 1
MFPFKATTHTQNDYQAHRALQKLTDPEIKERLRELLQLQRQRSGLHQQYLEEARQLREKYDRLYRPIYESQAFVIHSVQSFWLEVLKKSSVGSKVRQTEELLLEALTDIRSVREGEGESFTLEFEFKANDFLNGGVLKKTYHMSIQSDIERIEASHLNWRVQDEEVLKCFEDPGSFLHFFTSVQMPEPQELDQMEAAAVSAMVARIEEDYDTACELRDEVIPNAVFYFLDTSSEESDDRRKPPKTEVTRRKPAECLVQ